LVMLEILENVNTVYESIGRVHRLGQRRVQKIWIVGADHTHDQYSLLFHDITLARNCSKNFKKNANKSG